MPSWVHLVILALLHLTLVTGQRCPKGYQRLPRKTQCDDIDECHQSSPCGDKARCFNTIGSFYCLCDPGFTSSQGANFTKGSCSDINECKEEPRDICGPNASCNNVIGSYHCTCPKGFVSSNGNKTFTDGGVTCEDIDECHRITPCGDNARCFNTKGSFYCLCDPGFTSSQGANFTKGSCSDINECKEESKDICGPNASCNNVIGSYHCTCPKGFVSSNGNTTFTDGGVTCEDINECELNKTVCGQNAACSNTPGSYHCVCHAGFTNYGNRSRCTELNCNTFTHDNNLETLPGIQEVTTLLKKSCLELSESETAGLGGSGTVDGEVLLEKLLSMIDGLLSGGRLNDNRKVTTLLEFVESALRLVGALLRSPQTRRSYSYTEVELQVQRGAASPQGPLTLSSTHSRLDSTWETAAGEASSYPGFATVSLLSYHSLETSTNGYYKGVEPEEEDQSFQVNSKVVTATVSNKNTAVLKEPYKVVITLYHLNRSVDGNHTCVYWDPTLDGGSWSEEGCSLVESNANYTVCSCSHLSSFAVLMSLYDMKDTFQLQLITWVGLSLSLLCLFLCILTFSLCRSVQSTRNTIHLHLCLSLFAADLVFLAGISRTEDRVGCGVVAGLLHFLFLATFCWMFLEGVQLFRMVVLVFNTTIKPLYMMAGGYGVPAVIVTLSAIANAKGYGTERYCWLNWEDGFIWSFFGPVCAIIIVNVVFFLITVWKLGQKFSSLNPDLNNLYKIKAFTTTAVAQLCVLGTMWIFGCFQFDDSTIALSYIFTILNSLQGVLMFVMHCLLSKPVREEYSKLWSCVCAPQKYSDFSSNQTSKSQTSKSGQNTGESQI